MFLALCLNVYVGDALEIQEINNESYPQPMLRNVMYKTEAMAMDGAANPEIDFKKIKLNYQMRAIFELK